MQGIQTKLRALSRATFRFNTSLLVAAPAPDTGCFDLADPEFGDSRNSVNAILSFQVSGQRSNEVYVRVVSLQEQSAFTVDDLTN